MAIPKTFSAPGDDTFPALNGFAPSREDSLRFAVWLMLYADDVNRRAYSYDPEDETKGVRITQGRPDYDPETLALVLPCQLVAVAVASSRFQFSTSKAGELEVVIGVAHIEAANSSTIRPDADAPSLTAETRLDRVRQILMNGTIYEETQERMGKVVDPYRTPRNVDGTYDMSAAKWLSVQAPDVTPARRTPFPNQRVRNDAELLALDPVLHFAVSYGWLAKYTIAIGDRGTMR